MVSCIVPVAVIPSCQYPATTLLEVDVHIDLLPLHQFTGMVLLFVGFGIKVIDTVWQGGEVEEAVAPFQRAGPCLAGW